jgi:TetR/AcrR family transcriptional regulator
MTENDKLTEERIFEAATEVFEEKGLYGTRMQDIANHAGINKSLLHYYFRTKDHLFNAVFEKLAAKMFRKFAPVFEKDLSLEEKIKFFFRQHIEFMQENPRLPLFILNEINRNPARIRKLLKNFDFSKFWVTLEEQHKEEFKKYNITLEVIPQIMTTIAAMSVFPIAARPILEGIFENFDIKFDTYIEERKVFAAEFVIGALKSRSPENNLNLKK